MLTMLATKPHPHTAAEPGCRLCGARLHRSLLDLGNLPLATRSRAAGEADARYPLHVRLCDDCGLAQIPDAPPGVHAPPRPSPSPCSGASASRAGRYAGVMRERFRLDTGSLVVEIGLNDGTLLPHLQAAGIPVLRIPAEAADFNTETAMEAAVRHGCADIIVAHNVLPHAHDLFDFAAGLACILRPNGVLSLQFPHLLSLIQRLQFDAFRHDTYTYLSLPVAERLLRSVGLRLFDAERVPDEGGSLRLHACHAQSPHPTRHGLKVVRLAEALENGDQPALCAEFSDRVAVAREDIRTFLRVRREADRCVAAYGATARGTMTWAMLGTEAILSSLSAPRLIRDSTNCRSSTLS